MGREHRRELARRRVGTFRLSGAVTQPNPNRSTYVVRRQLDGFTLHVVFVESVNASAVTFTARGSVGSRVLVANGAIRTSSARAMSLTFAGKIGVTKISGKFPLSAFSITSARGVVKVSRRVPNL